MNPRNAALSRRENVDLWGRLASMGPRSVGEGQVIDGKVAMGLSGSQVSSLGVKREGSDIGLRLDAEASS